MTRGRHHNDAYIAASGEESAVDVFAASIARSWIDQPALARQAELAGHNPHRPGTLPPHELQGLLARQELLMTALAELRGDLEALPADLRDAREQQRRVVSDLSRARKRLQRAFDTLEARARDQRRPAMATELADVSDRLGDDRTVRAARSDATPPNASLTPSASDPKAATTPEPGTPPPGNPTNTKPPTGSVPASDRHHAWDCPPGSSTAAPRPKTPNAPTNKESLSNDAAPSNEKAPP